MVRQIKIEQIDANGVTDPCSVHKFYISPNLNNTLNPGGSYGRYNFKLVDGTLSNPPNNNNIIGQGNNMPMYNFGAPTPDSVSLDMNNQTVLDNKYGISNGVNTVPQGCTAIPNQISFVSTGYWKISISSIAVTRLDSFEAPVLLASNASGNLLVQSGGEATAIINL